LHLTSKIDDALREDFCVTKSKALSEGRRKVLKLLDENGKSRVRERKLSAEKVPLEKWHKKITTVFKDIETL
jgi:C4-type Zn-finger protein